MVFADAEHIESHLIGQLDLLEQVPHALFRGDHLAAARVRRSFHEAVNADLHLPSMDAPRARPAPKPVIITHAQEDAFTETCAAAGAPVAGGSAAGPQRTVPLRVWAQV